MDYTEWARKNKKALAENVIQNSNASTHSDGTRPFAIFMSGIPGAGKTEFLDRFLDANPKGNFVRIDLDSIVTKIKGYTPNKYYAYRGAANPILEQILDKSIKKGLDFALDGTFAHKNGIDNIERALAHGFFVVLIYIYQDPFVAWKVTKARELLTKRSIDKDGFISTYFSVPANVQTALDKYKGNDMVLAMGVIKDDLNKYSFRRDLTNIDDIVEKAYTKEELTDGIT